MTRVSEEYAAALFTLAAEEGVKREVAEAVEVIRTLMDENPGGKIEKFLEQYPNLYCDMSAASARIAMSRDPEYTYQLINRFPERFVYARDNFDNNLQEFLAQLNLSQDVLELIYHGNAERIVRKL